jgi:hypothetical protein
MSGLTPDTKREFIRLLKLNADCRNDVVKFSEEMLGIKLNSFQKRYLERSCTPRSEWPLKYGVEGSDIGGFMYGKNVVACSNQAGKTTAIAIKHLWFLYYKHGVDVNGELFDKVAYMSLNLSPHSRQVKQAYTYVKTILSENFIIIEEEKKRTNKLCPLLKDFLVSENATLGELRFRNGSVFYTVPTGHDQGSSLAGAQFGFISYDECSESDHLEQELPARIMSRLVRYGVGIDLLGTPAAGSKSHLFYMRIVKKGAECLEGWWSVRSTIDENTFIPRAQRERAKAEIMATDKNKYRQVFLGEFISSGATFFDAMEIDHMYTLHGPSPCREGRKYLMVSDWGMADSGDPSVHYILDYTDWITKGKIQRVAHETMTGGSPHLQLAVARSLYDSYTYDDPDTHNKVRPLYVMDAAAMGGVLIKKMLADISPKAHDIPKDEALMFLRRAMSENRKPREVEVDGSIIEENPTYGALELYYISEESEQLGVYHVDDDKLKQDYVMTLMMGVAYIYKKFPRAVVGVQSKGIDRLASYEQRGPGRLHKQRTEVTKLY